MIPVNDLISGFQLMYKEHWRYEWGKAETGCVDCSGAFVYEYRKFGISIPHGSNAIARGYTSGGMLPIDQARPGMAAFKVRNPGESGYDLPVKYMQSGDLRDYYHIGLVDDDTRYVLNAKGTQQGFCRDKLTEKNGWDFVAYLKDVEYQGESKMEQAKVVLPSGATGSTVNMRRVPSRSSDIIAKVPVGAVVSVTEDQGQWCQIEWNGKSGYMMSNYLEYTGQGGESDTLTPEEAEKIDNALKRMEEYARAILTDVEQIGSIVGRG